MMVKNPHSTVNSSFAYNNYYNIFYIKLQIVTAEFYNELNISSVDRVTERLDNIQNMLLRYVQGNKKELIKK